MKAILIDVVNREIKEIDINNENEAHILVDLYKIIGCEMVEAVDVNENHTIFVDEEGLLTLRTDSQFFQWGDNDPLVGNGVIVGIDLETGNVIPCTMEVEDVKEMVTFWNLREVENGMYRK